MPKTANSVAAKWVQRSRAAVTAYKSGVSDVTVSPPQLAARKGDFWLSQTQASLAKFVNNAGRVQLSTWINAASTKGATNYPVGIGAAQTKFQTAIAPVLTYITQVKGTLPPRGDTEANIARSSDFQRKMAQYKRPAGS